MEELSLWLLYCGWHVTVKHIGSGWSEVSPFKAKCFESVKGSITNTIHCQKYAYYYAHFTLLQLYYIVVHYFLFSEQKP